MRVRKQSTSTYGIPIYMVLSSDHVSAATGKTVSVTLSKNGGAFGAASGAVSELSSGVYLLAGNTTDTNTLGSLVVLATASGCDPYLVEYTVVSFDPFDSTRLGLASLPNAAAEASGGLFTRGTGAGQINQPANGMIDGNVVRWLGTAAATPATAGVPSVDVVYMSGDSTAADKFEAWMDALLNNTAQAGAAGTITFNSGASAVDDYYKGQIVMLTGGTGAGQFRLITAYVGATKVASVSPNWATNPDNTSTFITFPHARADLWGALGTVLSTPATAGVLDVNVKNMNNVAATSITTINANQGTTQPINFTGTGGSALAKSDMVDIAGAAVSTSSAQIGVNAVNIGGTAQTGRDIGASVLISSGTGTGQLDVTSGVIKANLAQILGTALTETAGQLAAAFRQFFNIASPTSTMNLITAVTTVTTTTTATNLTNAPTNGDFTATMKTSLNAATPASVTGAVGSVTGNVGGNVVGSVASVTAGVTVTTNNDKTGYTASTVTDKTGYALSSAGVQAIWDALTSALTTVGSVGKLLVDNINATIGSRMATFSLPTNFSSLSIDGSGRVDVAKVEGSDATDQIAGAVLNAAAASYNAASTIGQKINSAASGSDPATIADAIWNEAISGHLSAGSTGAKLNSAAAAGDPWSTALPGSYASGEAGSILAAINSKTAGISTGTITVTSPVVDADTVTIVRGDDYKNADGRALFATTTFSNAPSLTGGQVALRVKNGTTIFSKAGAITGAAACYVELTTSETAAFQPGNYAFDLQATLSNGDIVTIAQGNFNVLADVR